MSLNKQNPYADSNRQNLIWLLVGTGLLVAMLAFGFGSGYLRLPFGQNVAGLQKPGSSPQPSLEKPAATLPPVLMDTNKPEPLLEKEAKRMPPDILDWLKHLEETERRRKELSHNHMSDIMVTMTTLSLGGSSDVLKGLLGGDADVLDSPGPAADVKVDLEMKREEWRQLNEFFKSKTPPTKCVPIFNNYSEALVGTSSSMMDVLDALTKSSEDPNGAIASLSKMKGQSKGIDAAGKAADLGVQEICDEYDVRKWFSVSEDFGGGTMDKISGLIPKM